MDFPSARALTPVPVTPAPVTPAPVTPASVTPAAFSGPRSGSIVNGLQSPKNLRRIPACFSVLFLLAAALVFSQAAFGQSTGEKSLSARIADWFVQTRQISEKTETYKIVRYEADDWIAILEEIKEQASVERDRLETEIGSQKLQLTAINPTGVVSGTVSEAATETGAVTVEEVPQAAAAANKEETAPATGPKEDSKTGAVKPAVKSSGNAALEDQQERIVAKLGKAEDGVRSLNLLIEQVTQLLSLIQKRASSERLALVFTDRGSPLAPRFWPRLWSHAKAMVLSLGDASFRASIGTSITGAKWVLFAGFLGCALMAAVAPAVARRQNFALRLFVGDAGSLKRQERRLGTYLRWMMIFWGFLLLRLILPMGSTVEDLSSFLISIPLLAALLSLSVSQARVRSIAPATRRVLPESEEQASRLTPAQWGLRIFAVLVLMLVPIGFLSGYPNFARLLLNVVGATTFALAANQIARGYLFRGIRKRRQPETPVSGSGLPDQNSQTDLGSLGNRAVLYVAGEVLLIALSVILVLPFFGLSFTELGRLFSGLWNGAQYGPVYIRLSSWFGAFLVFLSIWFFVRLIRSYLKYRVLPHTGWDGGVQDAILATVTYAGFILAFIAAVSAAGVDMARLALIAGALSVGIGFGLQTIVNNVVSGLILLYERSIKPGDWVKVDGGVEGTIKQVRVRYTEIQTFDRASVIVPNATMVGGSVFNMTLGNTLGRLQLNVGIDYACNPRDVVSLLKDVASNFPMARKRPGPMVHFAGFGASGMDFTIKIFLSDINTISDARTSLAFAVYDALQENKIAIPFNRIDVQIVSDEGKPGKEKTGPEKPGTGNKGVDKQPDLPDPAV